MKRLILYLVVISITNYIYAQSPQKMSYQSVVRNASGVLVTNQSVGIKIGILQGTPVGSVVYQEIFTPNPQTNANGLVSIEIGGGLPLSGIFSAINWASGPYYLKTETDPTGGTSYTIVGTSQLLSVPYALYAKTAENAFSGNYNDLSNKPVLFDGTWANLSSKPSFATVAISGSYNDLINKPTLFSGNYNDLTNKPTISVLTDATISGNGTTALPLKIAQQSATTGQVLKWSGTTWLPGNDLTGVSSPGGSSGHVQFNNAGTFGGDASFFWDNTNKRLGLGAPSPASQLFLNGGNIFADLQLVNNTSGVTRTDGFWLGLGSWNSDVWLWSYENADLYFGTNNLRRLTINGVGNVGIGTDSPGGLLELYANSSLTYPHLLLTENEGDYSRLMFKNTVTSTKNWSIAGRLDPTDANSRLNFWYWNGSTGADVMSIRGNGNVGIGTTEPGTRLQVHNNITYANGITPIIKISDNFKAWNIGLGDSGDRFSIASEDYTERLTILKSNGNVGIGPVSPGYKLDVAGNLNINNGKYGDALWCNGSQALWYDGTYFSWGYDGQYNYFAAKVTIGNAANPGYMLYVQGNAYSTGSWSSSDARFKKNIFQIDHSLDKIMNIRGTTFEFRNDEFKDYQFAEGPQFGFIAQELENVFPEVVKTDSNGYKSVNYSSMIPVLLEAVKEQQGIIEKMENEIKDLTNLVNSLITNQSSLKRK
jgi:hypothetical protein